MRRPRYKGKYPKKPEQRYKEQNPEKYHDDIAHIESRGRTPLGTHKPIMVEEILEALSPKPGEIAVDLTLGYGGHSLEILKKIAPTENTTKGCLYGFDQDPIELPKTTSRLCALGFCPPQFNSVLSNFRSLHKELVDLNVDKVDIILGDLGLSSMQIDNPERGFSLKFDSPLDFRMDPSQGTPVAELIKSLSIEKFSEILRDFADEPFPHKIALEIKKFSETHELKTSFQLKSLIENIVKKISRYPDDPEKAVRRVFQALRIEVNQELASLKDVLEQIPKHLNKGARVAFLSFHSGEDRLVKKFFQNGLEKGFLKEIHGPIKANPDEIFQNRRSKSAKLRWGLAK